MPTFAPESPAKPAQVILEFPKLDTPIAATEKSRARNLIARATREVGSDYRHAMAWLLRRANSIRYAQENALRAARILATHARTFRAAEGVDVSAELQVYVDHGSLFFRVRPECPAQNILDQATGERREIPCTHDRFRALQCTRPHQPSSYELAFAPEEYR